MKAQDLLLGELREFKRYMSTEMRELRKEVKELNQFRWRVIGFSSAAAFAATLVAEFFKR